MLTRTEKATRFRALHHGAGAFVMPNAWNAGTARQLAAMGFSALGTTSAGIAMMLGVDDGVRAVSRAETLANAAAIAGAVDLPVSADLENGFGDQPSDCAATILAARASGLAGGSIEDATGLPDEPIYPLELAVERVRAAAIAAREGGDDFVLTARAENFLHGRPDLEDTIRRLRAFSEAGADVVYAPGLSSLEEIRSVASAVSVPLNVLMGLGAPPLSVMDLSALGVARISVGSALARTAERAFLKTAGAIRDRGTFDYS